MSEYYDDPLFDSTFMRIYEREINDKVEYYKNKMIENEKHHNQLILDSEKQKIKEKIRAREIKRQARELALKELSEEGIIISEKRREPISQQTQDAVWNRDGGKCVKCGSQENLEFDHIIPFSKGGSNTKRNIQLLCQSCNRAKSNNIG